MQTPFCVPIGLLRPLGDGGGPRGTHLSQKIISRKRAPESQRLPLKGELTTGCGNLELGECLDSPNGGYKIGEEANKSNRIATTPIKNHRVIY